MGRVRPLSLEVDNNVRSAWIDRKAVATIAPFSARPSTVHLTKLHGTGLITANASLINAEQDTKADERLRSSSPSNAAVGQQLTRILRSKAFVQSDKLSRFFRFVVQHVLDGNPSCLKEYLIGVEVYDRKPPYDPSQDSIVRTEARRLRSKLKEYYEGEGKEDLIYIYLRPGSYIPLFQSCEGLVGTVGTNQPAAIVLPAPTSVVTAVLPFRDISENQISSSYSRGIPDELSYLLMMNQGCSVLSPSSLAGLYSQERDFVKLMRKTRAHIAFEGSVRSEGSHLRVTARIMDATGAQVWVKRIDVEGATKFSFSIEEQVAAELSGGFDSFRTTALIQRQGSLNTEQTELNASDSSGLANASHR
jgi:TolB-like protein